MAKGKFTIAGPDDPIFKEGLTISTHRKKSNEVVCPKCNSNKAIFQYYNNEHDSPSLGIIAEKILQGSVNGWSRIWNCKRVPM